MSPRVSIVIACHNQAKFLQRAFISIYSQLYKNIEVIVLDDASTDDTKGVSKFYKAKYYKSSKPSGSGGAFNKGIAKATGEIIFLLCADDIITNQHVIGDVVNEFKDSSVGHVSRYYHQFVDGNRSPVRAWRSNNIIEIANNPSGLAFRAEAIKGHALSNKMFVEAPTLVAAVIGDYWSWRILKYDTVAVRIHKSTARSKDYYAKMWNSSPVEEWVKLGGDSILSDFTSLLQIKNYFTTEAVVEEIKNFIRLKPSNKFNPRLWFFGLIAIITPRSILLKVPEIYRATIGKWTTRVVSRET